MRFSYSYLLKIGILFLVIMKDPHLVAQQTVDHASNFTFAPKKPNAGDRLTFTYSADQEHNASQSFYASIYFLNEGLPSSFKINLVKEKNRYEGDFVTPDSSKAVLIKFIPEGQENNSDIQEYFLPLFKDGIPLQGAFIEIGKVFGPYSSTISVKRDVEKMANFFLQEFELHPPSREKYLSQYVFALRQLKKGNDIETNQFFEAAENSKANSEAELTAIENYWRTVGNSTKADEIKKKIETRFPKGIWLRNQKLKAFDDEKDLTKKDSLYEEFAILFPPQTDGEKYAFDDDLTWEMMEAFAVAGEFAQIPKYAARMYNADELAGVYHEIAVLLVGQTTTDVSKDLARGKQYLQKAFEIFETIRDNGDFKNLYYHLNNIKSLILFKEGNFLKAYETQKIAAKGVNNKIAVFNESLCVYAEKGMGITEAKKELELYIKTGIYTDLMKEQLKRIYLITESEETWSEYFVTLNKEYLERFRKRILKQVINEPAPLFVVKDLDGNKVNLKDLRGKIVVLDFWATWCVPCIKRFPGMLKTMEKYRGNPNIVFLFIDTWERVPESERESLITNFLKDNNLSFRVLLDVRLGSANQYKLTDEFRIEGIPTKIIINKKGKIVFKESSGPLDSDLFAEEMTIMIDIATH